MLAGLLLTAYSRARSHYCRTRGFLPAAFPPWAGSSLLRQPGGPSFRRARHIDAGLSADTRSTQSSQHQDPRPQAVHQLQPPSSEITGVRHHSQLFATFLELLFMLKTGSVSAYSIGSHQRKAQIVSMQGQCFGQCINRNHVKSWIHPNLKL